MSDDIATEEDDVKVPEPSDVTAEQYCELWAGAEHVGEVIDALGDLPTDGIVRPISAWLSAVVPPAESELEAAIGSNDWEVLQSLSDA